MKAIAALLCLMSATAGAICKTPTAVCLCDSDLQWVAKVEATTATIGTVREVFSGPGAPGNPPDAGMTASFNASGNVQPGDFVLLGNDNSTMLLLDGGTIARCMTFDLPADAWAGAVVNNTCSSMLISAGFKPPPCNDHGGCGCSTGSGAAAALALLVIAAIRRRA